MADVDAKLRQEISDNFSPEEIREMQSQMKARGFTSRGAATSWLRHQVSRRKSLVREESARQSEDPDFQTAVVRRQLDEQTGDATQVDLTQEGRGFGSSILENLSPILGGQGGSMDVQGEIKDAQEAFPGADVRMVSIPTQTGFKPQLMIEQNGKFVPSNRPGVSPGDFGNMVGDIGTLEGVGSLVPWLRPFKSTGFLGRAMLSAGGAGLGGAADELLNEQDNVKFANVVLRGSSGAFAAALGEAAGDTFRSALNFATRSTSVVPGSLEEQALKRALDAQSAGADVAAGQVSPMSFVGKLRTRWSQFTPALREQVLNQRLGVGQRLEDVKAQYLGADGVEQALIVGGLDREVLDQLEREVGEELQQKALQDLNAAGTTSRARAGQDVQEALFDVTNKEYASYRTLGNAKLYELENEMLEAAEAPLDFSINLTPSIRSAKDALAGFPLLQRDPNRIALEVESGRDLLGATVDLAKKKYQADLQFVLQTLDGLPEDALQNKGTYQIRIGKSGLLQSDPVRVDGDGSLRVPYTVTNQTGQKVANPGLGGGPGDPADPGAVIKTYELSGVETVRMLRGKLRDFFGNELLPSNGSEVQLARKLYLQLGEALENVEGAPDFTKAVQRYNRTSKNFLDRIEMFQNAGFAKAGNGQQLVTSFTSGAMDFTTLNNLKNTLRRVPGRGEEAWANYRNAATRDFLQNPEKIDALDIEPKTAGVMYSPQELQVLRNYAGVMDDMQKSGFVPVARRAAGERGKALALFQTTQDNAQFGKLWNQLDDTQKNLMRFAIVEDMLNKSKSDFAGTAGVWNPQMYSNRVQDIMSGDTGERMKMIFPESTLKELEDVGAIAAFYRDVQGQADVGASIRAQQVVGGAVPEGAEVVQAPFKAAGSSILGAISVNFERILGASLAEGKLGKILAPRLHKPIPAIQKIPAYTALAATSLNAQIQNADSDFTQKLQEAAERARAQELKTRRGRNR